MLIIKLLYKSDEPSDKNYWNNYGMVVISETSIFYGGIYARFETIETEKK